MTARDDSRHSSTTAASGVAVPSTSDIECPSGRPARPSIRRPAGFSVRTTRSSPTTSSPDVMLAMICSLRRSEASARFFMACCCRVALTSLTATNTTIVTNATAMRRMLMMTTDSDIRTVPYTRSGRPHPRSMRAVPRARERCQKAEATSSRQTGARRSAGR